MLTTGILLLACIVALLLSVVLWIFFLKIGARWAHITGLTTGRAFLALLIMTVAQFLLGVPLGAFETFIPWPVQFVLELALAFTIPIATIAILCRATAWQAFRAWLPTLLVAVFGVALALLVFRPFLFEAFKIPTNAMAPTILGIHFTVDCPRCGKPAYGSPFPGSARDAERPAICSEFHVHTNLAPIAATGEGDRIMVAKFLSPQRWDIIVFRYPGDPSLNYVDRLVGLPGETVFIKDGAVWINGQKLDPPSSLKGMEYVTEIPHLPPFMRVAGTPDSPAALGPDEYFVLGDFSSQSMDSRLWEKGAPGHHAYAVPESYIIGVATHIYWPPSRWRILR